MFPGGTTPPVRIIIERNSGFGKPVWPENAGFPALSGMKPPYFVPRNASIRSRRGPRVDPTQLVLCLQHLRILFHPPDGNAAGGAQHQGAPLGLGLTGIGQRGVVHLMPSLAGPDKGGVVAVTHAHERERPVRPLDEALRLRAHHEAPRVSHVLEAFQRNGICRSAVQIAPSLPLNDGGHQRHGRAGPKGFQQGVRIRLSLQAHRLARFHVGSQGVEAHGS